MKVLIVTNLWPNPKEPVKAQYNVQQFGALSKMSEVKLVSPIPMFKFSLVDVPAKKMTNGIETYYPRYLVTPKFGRSLYWLFMYLGIAKLVEQIYKSYRFDVIFVTWAYPDGAAASVIAKKLKVPIVISACGSDINVMGKYFLRRMIMKDAFLKAQKVIAVSASLREKIVSWGIPAQKIELLPNGVDVQRFRPMARDIVRSLLGLPLNNKFILYVGNLEPVKGIDVLVKSLASLPKEVSLIVIGDGTMKPILNEIIIYHKLEGRVHFMGQKPHDKIPEWMNAADIFCLPSRNEGCPNVVLEALACGRPIVATKVGGIPDMVKDRETGILVNPDSPEDLANGIKEVFEKKWDASFIRQSVLNKSWGDNAAKLKTILSDAISSGG